MQHGDCSIFHQPFWARWWPTKLAYTQYSTLTARQKSERSECMTIKGNLFQNSIGVEKGSRPPLPPNRACGSPAHGSPVSGSHIGVGSPVVGVCFSEKPQLSEFCIWPISGLLLPLTPLPSAANMRSAQMVRSTHSHPVGADSACIALAGTSTVSLMLSLLPSFPHPFSCLPSLGTALLSALSRPPLHEFRLQGSPPSMTPVSQPFRHGLLFSLAVIRRL